MDVAHIGNRTAMTDMANFVFIVRLAGLVDIMNIIKFHSLQLQKVNVLPWEQTECMSTFSETLTSIKNYLKCHLDQSNIHPRGAPFPASLFPFLTSNAGPLFYTQAKWGPKEIQLELDVGHEDNIQDACDDVVSYLHDFCAVVLAFYSLRVLIDIPEQINDWMLCLDLRKFALNEPIENEQQKLEKLYNWAVDEGKLQLPPLDTIVQQHAIVRGRVHELFSSPASAYKRLWLGEKKEKVSCGLELKS